MTFTLLASSRRRLAAMGLLVLALLPLPNCGGGGDPAVSDATSSSSAAAFPNPDSIIDPPQTDALSKRRADRWGAAPSAALARAPEAWLGAMADAGVTTVRNFDDSAATGDKLTPILKAGLSAVGILWMPGTSTLPVNELDAWRSHVSSEVTAHKGRVKYWEVWNEPPNFTEDKSPASYAKVVAAAYDAAKAADPSVQIGLAAKSNHINFLAESIAAGAADKFDFVTLHPYETAELLPEGWEGQFMSIVPRLRRMLQSKNPGRAQVPVWFTEIGISAAPPPGRGNVGPPAQADVLVKIYAMAFAQGAQRVYWFDPRDSEGLNMGLTTADGTKRPAWFAMRSMSSALGPQPGYLGWLQPDNAWYGFVFDAAMGVVLVAWTRPGDSTALALASPVTAIDPRSGAASLTDTPTLGDAPLLLVAPADSPQAAQWRSEALSNVARPFPWNGDHSASRSVRLTAGAQPQGVFIVHPPPLSAQDGVAEFDVQGSIGACFAVDPTFVSYAYASTALQITAQVRGHGSGSPGFELRYESDAPIAATDGNNLKLGDSGWFAIRGTDVVEKTWRLPDTRFIGLYGYHFCFYAPDPALNSGFSIRRVTVRR